MKMPEYVAVKIMPDKKGTSYNLEVVTDADFVNVVWCKYCMWWDWGWCNNWERGTDENGFCHDAKRKVTE